MELTDRERDLLEALSGTAKSTLSIIPVLGQAIAGWSAYKRSSFDRHLLSLIQHLSDKIDDMQTFFSQDYFSSKESEPLVHKIIDSVFDTQIEDKQELFVNALLNAPSTKTLSELQKLKYIDMLRHLSLAALMVLAEMHKIFIGQVRGAERNADRTSAFPLVNPDRMVEKLGHQYEPYLVTSAIYEMQSQGLFSKTGEWGRGINGRYIPLGGFESELCYTDFTAKFVEFITINKKIAIGGKITTNSD